MSNPLIKNCLECQQIIQERLKDCKDWETKKKQSYQKIQEEICLNGNTEIDNSRGYPINTTHNHESGVNKYVGKYKTQNQDNSQGDNIVWDSCPKCQTLTTNDNCFGDSNVNNHNCKVKDDTERERERERAKLLNYFQKNNIKSITLKDNKLVIKYNNREEEMEANNTELQLIQSYCQQQGLTSLSLSDLQESNQEQGDSKPTNWTPYLIGGVGIVGVIIGVVWLVSRNKREK